MKFGGVYYINFSNLMYNIKNHYNATMFIAFTYLRKRFYIWRKSGKGQA